MKADLDHDHHGDSETHLRNGNETRLGETPDAYIKVVKERENRAHDLRSFRSGLHH